MKSFPLLFDSSPVILESESSGFFTVNPHNELGNDLTLALLKMGSNKTNLPQAFLGNVLIEKSGVALRTLPVMSADNPAVVAASRTIAEKQGSVGVAVPICKIGNSVVWKRLRKVEAVTEAEALIRQIKELETLHGILVDMTGNDIVEKADKPNPMTDSGFTQLQNSVRRELVKITNPMDASQLTQIIRATAGNDWLDSKDKRDAVVKAIREAMPDRKILKTGLSNYHKTMVGKANVIHEGVRKSFEESQNIAINMSLSLKDEEAIKALVTSGGLFVRDSYGNRADMMSQKAKTIVQSGLDKGLGRADIADLLRASLGETYEAHRRGYLNVISSTFVSRARSRSMTIGYQEAQVEYAQILAIMDKATSEICRFLDGQQISVSQTVTLMNAVDSDPNHEAVKSIMPWIKESKGGLSIPGKGVLASRNEDGTLTQNIKARDFGKNGIGFPPYHGNCRTTTIGITKRIQVQVSRLTPTGL